jgi:hypothetical protein
MLLSFLLPLFARTNKQGFIKKIAKVLIKNLPINWLFSLLDQYFVRLGEMTATEESGS